MALEPFLVNPPKRRRLMVFGANPRRRKRRNPPTRVSFPAHTETLFRVSKTGRWGKLKSRKKRSSSRKGRVPPHLKKYLFKKRRSVPASKESPMKRKRSRRSRRARSHRRNPFIPLGANPRRRRRSRKGSFARRRSFRRNPGVISKLGLPPVREMAFLAAGAVAARMLVPRALLMLPMLSANGYVRAVSRVAIVGVASLLAQKALGANARTFIYGAVANQLPEAVNDVASQFGVKLGLEEPENELSLYTMSAGDDGAREIPLGIYTDPNALSAGEEVPVG
jgi:hypothetical protein